MVIDKEMVEYVANLSRIQLDSKQSELMVQALGTIVEYIDLLKTVDTDGIEPLSHVFPLTNVTRPDVVSEHFDRELLLQNAPDSTDEFFVVPQAVDV